MFGSLEQRDVAVELIRGLVQRSADLADTSARHDNNARGQDGAFDEFRRMVVKRPWKARNAGELTLEVDDIVVVAKLAQADDKPTRCEQCNQHRVAAQLVLDGELLRLCRQCVATAQELAGGKDSARGRTNGRSDAESQRQRLCQQCRQRKAVARATLPDGIQIKVCALCVEGGLGLGPIRSAVSGWFAGLRKLEERQSGLGAEAQTPAHQIKELKIRKMMLAGQIGGLQRQLSQSQSQSSPDLRAQYNTLQEVQKKTRHAALCSPRCGRNCGRWTKAFRCCRRWTAAAAPTRLRCVRKRRRPCPKPRPAWPHRERSPNRRQPKWQTCRAPCRRRRNVSWRRVPSLA